MCYWEYLVYLIEHKWNVGIECIRRGMFWHAITHDLSKFLPREFFAYANYFFGKNKSDKVKEKFSVAWNYHQKTNKHHWNYWVCIDSQTMPIPMPKKYVKQMVCDWRGMSRKFGDTALEYFIMNQPVMRLHEDTVRLILKELHVPDKNLARFYK